MSPGAGSGAIKAIEHLRGVLAHVGALVVPRSISVAGVRSAFDAATGTVTDRNTEQALQESPILCLLS